MSVDKLVDSTQLDSDLTSVADAIRTKGGTSAALAFPAEFVSAIAAIPSGGGGSLKYEIGTFTLENDVVNQSGYAIPHNLGIAPDVVFVWPTPNGGTGPQRGYFYFKAPLGETQQYITSTGTSDYPVVGFYYVSSFGPPLKTRISTPGSSSYSIGSASVPTAANIYLFKFASSATWYAGTYNYFISEKWW